MGMRFAVLLVFVFVALHLVSSDQIINCYWGTWANYRPGDGKFEPSNIDTSLCTHISYTFFGISESGEFKSLDPWLDLDSGLGFISKTIALKQKNSNLKIIATVGGWNEGSNKYSAMAADPNKRALFISSALSFIQEHGFDGLDVDWEYPVERGGVPEDRNNFVTLLSEIKQVFDQHGLELSIAVGASKARAEISYDIPAISQHVSYINVMTYDFHMANDGYLGFNTPLPEVQQAIDYWLEKGAPAQKLVLGLAFYGHTYQMADSSQNGPGDRSSGPGTAGKYTQQSGFLGYNEICLNNWAAVFNEEYGAPYAFQDNQWVSYDNVQSIERKMKIVNTKSLAGAMVWSIETDDFRGRCGESYPLLKAIRNAVSLAEGDTESVVTSKPSTPTTSAATTATSAPVAPTQSSACSSDGYFRHSTDCQRFYQCVAGRRFEFTCPNGLYFDPNLLVCNWSSAVSYNIFCYWDMGAFYRRGHANFQSWDVDPRLCTHLACGFFGIDERGAIEIGVELQNIYLDLISYAMRLKQTFPHLKVFAAIGGWKEEKARKFSDMAADARKRHRCVSSITDFVNQWNFDGVDLDWEFPTQRGGRTRDRYSFAVLLKKLKTKLKEHGRQLSVGVLARVDATTLASYDVPKIAQHVDFINMLTHDFRTPYALRLTHNAPLGNNSNIELAVIHWAKHSGMPSKLLLGIPFFASTYTLQNPNLTAVGSYSNGPGSLTALSGQVGCMGYNEFCTQASRWTQKYDANAQVAYAYSGNQWLSYDNARSIAEKMRLVRTHKLGGAMVWSIDTDDFRGNCGERYGLLRTINEAIGDPSVFTLPEYTTQNPATCVQDGFYRRRFDCQLYYECRGGERFDYKCIQGQYFDEQLGYCSPSKLVRCIQNMGTYLRKFPVNLKI
ncbi:acidic mammalian chitinase-like [Scaptodrosophila lebanonensis]|uniref:chitinase n=1 Tax=Drosophila lebanonensis TaxID=7225 RepID=A0A6J2T0Z2_DROLE|nr:acidic mammalian chitinase-like [Scaptodrosophila lebanonensis]